MAVELDLNLYRREVAVTEGGTPVRLSVIDVAPQAIQRTLVFLHGFGGHALQWAPQLQALAAENRVIAIDLRGHGLSDCPGGPYDLDTLVTDVERALRALEVGRPFVLLGHSFGGALAALYAHRHPQDVERLVLVATAARLRLHRGLEWVFRLPAPFLERVRGTLKRHFFAPARVLKSMYFDAMCRWDGDQVFPALSQPTLVIQGHRDIVFPKGDYRRVARLLPQAEEVIVPVSAHLVQLERAEAVTRAIRRFLTPMPLSWRDATAHTAPLTAERPWVRFYDPGVPATVVVPDQPLHRFLDSAVRRFARRPALRFEGKTISYASFEERANRCANALLGLGVQRGDRVALLLPNVPQFAVACFGAWRAGAVIVPLDPRLPDGEIRRLLEASGARVLVALDEHAERAADLWSLRRTGERVLVLTGRGDEVGRPGWRGRRVPDDATSVLRWPEWLAAAGYARPRLRVNPDDLAAILPTGGTTAPSRAVMLTHRNLVANTVQTRHWFANAREGHEVVLAALPLSHAYGLMTCLTVPVALAASVVLLTAFDPEQVARTIQHERPSLFPGVPAMYVALNALPDVRRYGFDSITACLSGSTGLPLEVQEAFEKLTRGRLVEGYGLTEASPITHANPLFGTRKVGTIGVPLPNTDARIVHLDDPDRVLGPGEIGELQVRGPQVMRGYWQDERATAAALRPDGWLRTGDLARVDADGFFQVVERRADAVRGPDGSLLLPRDVEEVLYEHPAVREAAAVIIRRGEEVTVRAAVVPAEPGHPPDPEALREWLARRLPPHLVPAEIALREALPRTLVGKVVRRALFP